MKSRNLARALTSFTVAAASVLATVAVAPPSRALTGELTRAPYLSDLTSTSVKVNFGTSTSIVKVRARYGLSSTGSCTASTTTGTTGKQAFTVTYPAGTGTATAVGNQWKVQISGLSPGTYCYRIEGTTSATSTTYTDLLDPTTASPSFRTSAASSFAVIGDWGQTGPSSASFVNAAQANVIGLLSRSGVPFALSTGDIGYNSGSQTNYGDLTHTGPDVSAVFGPKYWPVAGRSVPMFPVPGNHGFSPTFTSLWPSTSVAAASGGQASNGSHDVNGTPVTTPDYWFAYNVAGWRIYNLTAAWGATVTTGSTPYGEDYKQHWAPGAAERAWLTSDLTKNNLTKKIAVFHYPLYSAVRSGDNQDNFLTTAQGGAQSVEQLLWSHNVKLVLNGHSHIYERNNAHHGLVSIVSGGGGAGLSPVDSNLGAMCTQKYADTATAVVAFARGWSVNGGSACNTTKPTSTAQVYHYLLVTLANATATVKAIDSTGSVFDTTVVS